MAKPKPSVKPSSTPKPRANIKPPVPPTPPTPPTEEVEDVVENVVENVEENVKDATLGNEENINEESMINMENIENMENVENVNNGANGTGEGTGTETGAETPIMRAVQSRNKGMKLAKDKYECIYALAKQGFKAEDVCELTLANLDAEDDMTIVTIETKAGKGETIVKTAKLSIEESLQLGKYIDNEAEKIIMADGMLFPSKKPLEDGGKVKPNNMTTGLRDYLGKTYNIGLGEIGWLQESKAKSKSKVITDMAGLKDLLSSMKAKLQAKG